MPKEMDTNLRDFTPLRPPQKSNLALPFAAVLLIMLVLWWVFIIRDPPRPSSPRPVLAAVDLMPPPSIPRLMPPPMPPQPLTDLHLLGQLNTTATEQLWTVRAAVLIIGRGVLGIFTVARRLKKVAPAREREIDLLMGVALGQQRGLLTQLDEELAKRPPRSSYQDDLTARGAEFDRP